MTEEERVLESLKAGLELAGWTVVVEPLHVGHPAVQGSMMAKIEGFRATQAALPQGKAVHLVVRFWN